MPHGDRWSMQGIGGKHNLIVVKKQNYLPTRPTTDSVRLISDSIDKN